MSITSYRDLRVWRAGIDLVERIYLLARAFPAYELYALTSQIRRAAVSVPSNIAEGHAREHRKEYLHHLSMAQGSLAEVQTLLEIAGRLAYLSPQQLGEAQEHAAAVARQLHALRAALKRPAPGPGQD